MTAKKGWLNSPSLPAASVVSSGMKPALLKSRSTGCAPGSMWRCARSSSTASRSWLRWPYPMISPDLTSPAATRTSELLKVYL